MGGPGKDGIKQNVIVAKKKADPERICFLFCLLISVPETLQRSRYLASSVDHLGRRAFTDFHYWTFAEKASEVEFFSDLLAYRRYDPYRCRLGVDHSDSSFVCNDA